MRLRTAGGIVLGAVVALLAIMVGVTLRASAPVIDEARVLAPINTDSAAAHLAGVVRFATVSRQDGSTDSAAFRAQMAYLEQTYPLTHQRLARDVVAGLSLLYTWRGRDTAAAPVVLMGHLDVVPVIPGTEGQWTHGAFEGVVAGGYVWGRGTLDDKVTVVAILEAVEGALQQGYVPPRTIYLAFGHDEESGGDGAKAIKDLYEARKVKAPALVLDEGGFVGEGVIPGVTKPVALVGVAEKGFVSLTLSVSGDGGHSSTPPAVTHIGRVAKAITALEAHQFPGALDGATEAMFTALAPSMPFGQRLLLTNLWITRPLVKAGLLANAKSAAMLRTTTAATIFNAGVKDNVLPPTASAVVNFRIRPGETTASVQARVVAVIADTAVHVSPVAGFTVDPSPVSDASSAAFGAVAKTIRQTLGATVPVVAPYVVPGGTDARHWSSIARHVFRFNPFPFEADAMTRFHGTNERVSVTGFADGVRYYAQLLHNLEGF